MIRRTTSFLSMTQAMGAFACLAALATGSVSAQAQASAEMKNQARQFAQICRSDFKRLCADVRLGGGRGLACLQRHVSQVTPPCQAVLPQAEAMRNGAVR